VSKQWHTSTACHITASTVHSNTNDNSHRTPTLAPNASRWGPIFYSTATDPTLATNASGWGRMLAGMGPNDVTRHLGSGMFFLNLIYSSANIYIGIFMTTTPTTPTTDPPSLQTRVGGSVPFFFQQRTHPRYKRESMGLFFFIHDNRPILATNASRWGHFHHQRVTTTRWWVSFRFHPRRRPFAPPTSHDDSLVGFLFIFTHDAGPLHHQRVTTTRWWGFLSFSPTTPALCTTNES
jgi:hypothetical protein